MNEYNVRCPAYSHDYVENVINRLLKLLHKNYRYGTPQDGSPDTDIAALRPGGGLGLTAEAHARIEGQLARKKYLESRVRGALQLSTG